jgi:hypothetical protein
VAGSGAPYLSSGERTSPICRECSIPAPPGRVGGAPMCSNAPATPREPKPFLRWCRGNPCGAEPCSDVRLLGAPPRQPSRPYCDARTRAFMADLSVRGVRRKGYAKSPTTPPRAISLPVPLPPRHVREQAPARYCLIVAEQIRAAPMHSEARTIEPPRRCPFPLRPKRHIRADCPYMCWITLGRSLLGPHLNRWREPEVVEMVLRVFVDYDDHARQ